VIDSHAHLDACADPPGDVLARAHSAGVTRVIAIGSGVPSCRAALEVAEGDGGVHAALGIHPHQAGETTAAELEALRRLLGHPGAVAVGETGLDYFRDYAPRRAQIALFGEQLTLARDLGKALVVHSREADADTLEILSRLDGSTAVVLHCFSSPGLLDAALERDYYVSFAGNVTYPGAGELRDAARRVPAERILAETDSPYLAPQPVRGRPNEPAYVVHVLRALAEARGDEPSSLERQIEENAARAFDLP
jgi:TatD DNase family protein